MQVSSARAPSAPSSSAASVAVNTSPMKACRDIANPLPGFARPYQHPRAAVEAQRLRRATRLSILRRLVDLAARRVQMALFIVSHRHEPERCPATDPYRSAMLLNYLSRPNVRFQIPRLDPSTWRLGVGGLVDRPLRISLRELGNMRSETLPGVEPARVREQRHPGRGGSRPVGLLLEEEPQRRVGGGLGLGVLDQRVHLPWHAVRVADPELVGLGVAAGRPLLLEQLDLLVLDAHHLGSDVPRAGVADTEVADGARHTAGIEGQDHGRVADLELRVVAPDLGRFLAEDLPIAGYRGVEVVNVQGDVERVVGHAASSFIDRCRYTCTSHRFMSISTHVDEAQGAPLLCAAVADPPRTGRRRGAG